MRRPRIDPLAVIGAMLFVVLIGLTLVREQPDPNAASRSGSVYDDGRGGASLFRRYLEDAGLRVELVQGDAFAPQPTAYGVLFLLGSTSGITDAERARFHDFVRAGGTLVVATDIAFNERALLADVGVARSGRGRLADAELPVRSIAFALPPVRAVAVDVSIGLDAPSAIPLVGGPFDPFAVAATEGRGEVIVVGSLAPFLNASIGAADNAHFGLALAQSASGRVGFDEYHHGVRPQPDITALLVRTWLGRAFLGGIVVLFASLALSGRRLGPPVPLDPRPPLSSLQFIRAFARLARRSGHGEIAHRRLRADLHRALARQTGMDPAAPFERVVAAVAATSPGRAQQARALDAALASRLRDDALVRAARDVRRLVTSGEGE